MDKELNFRNVIEKIEILDKWLLLKLAIDVSTPKDRYLRNSIAKSITLLKSINNEYERQSYNEGWILFRALIDRLVYIYYINEINPTTEGSIYERLHRSPTHGFVPRRKPRHNQTTAGSRPSATGTTSVAQSATTQRVPDLQ